MKILQIAEFPSPWIDALYAQNGGLPALSYGEQVRALFQVGLRAEWMLAPWFDGMQTEAHFSAWDCLHTQVAWLAEAKRNVGGDDLRVEALSGQIGALRPEAILATAPRLIASGLLAAPPEARPLVVVWQEESPEGADLRQVDLFLSPNAEARAVALRCGAPRVEAFLPGASPWMEQATREIGEAVDLVVAGAWPVADPAVAAAVEQLATAAAAGAFTASFHLEVRPGTVLPPAVAALQRGGCFGITLPQALRRGRIVFPVGGPAGDAAIDCGWFAAAALGRVLLARDGSGLRSCFAPGGECLAFREPAEAVEIVRDALARPDERARLAAGLQSRTARDHMLPARAARLAALLGSLRPRPAAGPGDN